MEQDAKKCSVAIPVAKYRNDVLHPCVRYIEEGFGGHRWWMVQSPHYGRDDSIENPILFYGDPEPDGTPPLTWHFAEVVRESPETGYNSDPNLCFADGRLYVLWREFQTERVIDSGYNSVIYAVAYDRSLRKGEEIFVCGEPSPYDFTDLSPVAVTDGRAFDLYTMHFRFDPSLVRRAAAKFLRMAGFRYSAHKTIGIRRLTGESVRTLGGTPESRRFRNAGGRQPWHFDIVTYKGRMLLLVFCRMRQNIFLAASDGREFVLNDRPLLPEHAVGDTYKPTGVVVGDDLYLYYTDKAKPDDPKQNELFRYRVDLRRYLDESEG